MHEHPAEIDEPEYRKGDVLQLARCAVTNDGHEQDQCDHEHGQRHEEAIPARLPEARIGHDGYGTERKDREIDDAGQVRGASAVVVEPDHARDRERRWGGDEHKPYETAGGVRVRSRAEYIIATKLEAEGIPFEYEPRLPYTDGAGRTRFIHPDFYLYEHDLYVEYWGRDDPEYVESRRFKEGVYERLAAQRGVRVLHLEAGDVENDVFIVKMRIAVG